MSLKRRLEGLATLARSRHKERRTLAAVRRCRGLSRARIAELVEASCPADLLPLLDEVVDRAIADETKRIEQAEAEGDTSYMPSGFFVWLRQLSLGVASLPETLPECVIRAWHQGSPGKDHPAASFHECIPW